MPFQPSHHTLVHYTPLFHPTLPHSTPPSHLTLPHSTHYANTPLSLTLPLNSTSPLHASTQLHHATPSIDTTPTLHSFMPPCTSTLIHYTPPHHPMSINSMPTHASLSPPKLLHSILSLVSAMIVGWLSNSCSDQVDHNKSWNSRKRLSPATCTAKSITMP